jgi:conjugal transfer pilus assembly protein TraA
LKLNRCLQVFAVVALAAIAGTAVAGQVDTNDAFYTFYETINSWVAGPLGVGLAITMLLMGGAIGVAQNSPLPALSGIAGAAFLHWGPTIIKQIMVGGALV